MCWPVRGCVYIFRELVLKVRPGLDHPPHRPAGHAEGQPGQGPDRRLYLERVEGQGELLGGFQGLPAARLAVAGVVVPGRATHG